MSKVFLTGAVCFYTMVSQAQIPPQGSSEWNAKMSQMATTLLDLIPYLFDDKKFDAAENLGKITDETRKLNQLAHSIDQMQPSKARVAAADQDPAIQYISHEFKEQVARGFESLTAGNREYAKYALRTSVSYCISCHTMTNMGPELKLSNFDSKIKSLAPVTRMALLAATRQFDAALDEYSQTILKMPASEITAIDFERATRIAMAVSVRVKNDVAQIQKLLKKASSRPHASGIFKEDMEVWRKDVARWKKEPKRGKQSEQEMLKTARNLVSRAQKWQKYPVDARGDISYLRASAVLHDLLRDYPNSSHLGEILYLSGQTYDSLRDLGFWRLHEMYFEACILKSPHSELAQKCFGRLKDSLIEGYTGSRGLSIPLSVSKRLSALEQMANPIPKAN